ncbi:MAG: hypothetical protein AAB456_00575 [Patescibacteria group bacterium]
MPTSSSARQKFMKGAMHELKHAKKKRPRKQRIAIALSKARKAGY